ncbi:MAG: TRASH domain-containing protein, partial [Candidatus Heimdallarchaeaceae archaeon]
KDSRISYSQLAKLLKLTVPTIKSRIDKLVSDGFIEHFTIDINYNLLTEGKQNIIFLKSSFNEQPKIANILYNHPLINKILFTTGTYNLVAFTHHISENEKKELINWIHEETKIKEMEFLFIYEELPEKKEFTIKKPIDVKIICDYCKREFSGDIFSKVIGNKKRYFCCTTCLEQFEKRFQEEKNKF